METKSFNIYSNLGFIGFIILKVNDQRIDATLILSDNVTIENNSYLCPDTTINDIFQLGTLDMLIIQNLMMRGISSLRSNGLNYFAIDSGGTKRTI